MRAPWINRLAAVAALVVSCLLMLGGIASAQPGYGDGAATIELSATVSGDGIIVTGRGFEPGEPVTGTVFSDPMDLGTTNADQAGAVSFTFSVRGLAPGEHRVVLSAPSATVSATFTVRNRAGSAGVVTAGTEWSGSGSSGSGSSDDAARSGSGSSSSGSSSDGDLAYTGSDSLIPLATIGVLLVLGGAVAVLAGRRSRQDRVNR